jgi:hypothetical protein
MEKIIKLTEKEFEKLLERTQKNAVQMVEDFQNNEYKEYEYEFFIHEDYDEKIKIRITKNSYEEIYVTFSCDADIYPAFYESCMYNNWSYTTMSTAAEFCNDLKRIIEIEDLNE